MEKCHRKENGTKNKGKELREVSTQAKSACSFGTDLILKL